MSNGSKLLGRPPPLNAHSDVEGRVLQMADEVIQELLSDSSAFLAGWDQNSQQVQALLQASLQEKGALLAEQQALTGLIATETAMLQKASPFLLYPIGYCSI